MTTKENILHDLDRLWLSSSPRYTLEAVYHGVHSGWRRIPRDSVGGIDKYLQTFEK